MRNRLLLACLMLATGAEAQDCEARLYASGYGSNNIHVYDGCTGEPIANLDRAGNIVGAQATALGADGFLYVVSEENGRILRYRAEDRSLDGTFAGGDGPALNVRRPTGLTFAPDGSLLVAGYDSNDVVRLDATTGAQLAEYDLGSVGLQGADAGMVVTSEGLLLVPGFDSNSIAAVDLESGNVSEWAASGTGGLRNPRVIVDDVANDRFLVTSWGSNRILAFDRNGGYIEDVLRTIAPTGLVIEATGTLLVTSDQLPQVTRYGASGTNLGIVVTRAAGGLDGATFLTLTGSTVSEGEPGGEPAADQSWIIGAGAFDGLTLTVEGVITGGAAFGDAFDPSAVNRFPWGTLSFTLADCASGAFAWTPADATVPAGSYDVVRVAPNRAQAECEATGLGVGAATGTWFGGAPRDGEGFMIDVLDDSSAVLTWYTYRVSDV
ncbi:MAG: PQQ-binding-like beta-propeller repeat protein [Pseudomonadota bacterium]